jgi:serine/threonine protein phosphatase 1
MRWVVGDIHGMLRPLKALLDAVRAADRDARFFFVGDYVNRGPDSRGVIDLLLALPDARFVRGNHDDMFDLVLHGQCYNPHPHARDPLAAFAWFVQHGLWETLVSYGEDYEIERVARRPTDDGVRALFEAVPQSHRTFVRTLPPVVETADFFVAHARWDPDDPDDRPSIAARLLTRAQLRHGILWGRYADELTRTKRWRRTGYFGHTPVETYPPSVRGKNADNVPIRAPQIVLLDTGVALSPAGRLSAVCADDGRLIQVGRLGEAVTP